MLDLRFQTALSVCWNRVFLCCRNWFLRWSSWIWATTSCPQWKTSRYANMWWRTHQLYEDTHPFYISVIIISKVAKNQQWWLWYVIYRYAVFRLINIPVSFILHSNPEPKGSCSKTSLQFVIKNCTDLTVLWLQHLYNLVHVDLSYNSLKVLEAAHTRLGNIKTLSLAGNQLDQLTGLTKLYSLVNLDLSHNQLAQVITLWMSRWSRCPSDVDAFKDIFLSPPLL